MSAPKSAEEFYVEGEKYYWGRGVPKDFNKARDCHIEASKQNHAEAQYRLGELYFFGNETMTQDYALAMGWFRLSADQGYKYALYKIGSMYERGLGVPQNYDDAIDWFTRAMNNGHAHAQGQIETIKNKQKQAANDKEWRSAGVRASTESARSPDFETNIVTEITDSELTLGKIIGEGTFGVVFKGEWNGTTVAVKCIKHDSESIPDFVVQDFRREVAILLQLRHPNVVMIMGAQTTPPRLKIVTEFLSGGSLYDVLHEQKKVLNAPVMKKLALQIAQGMNYLHHRNILHRDLKSLNILVDEFMQAKICDFGLSRTSDNTMTRAIGTPVWMAPELLGNEKYDNKVDVYAFGIVLYEITTGIIPFMNLSFPQIIAAVLVKKSRPEFPGFLSRTVKQLIQACWHHDPKMRPTFDDILVALKGLE